MDTGPHSEAGPISGRQGIHASCPGQAENGASEPLGIGQIGELAHREKIAAVQPVNGIAPAIMDILNRETHDLAP